MSLNLQMSYLWGTLLKVVVLLYAAFASNKVGEFTGNGFIFKDTVEVVAVEDPDGN
jgi:hypothetical protein